MNPVRDRKHVRQLLSLRPLVPRLFEADLPSAPATVDQNRGTQRPTLLCGKSRAAIYIRTGPCTSPCAASTVPRVGSQVNMSDRARRQQSPRRADARRCTNAAVDRSSDRLQ
jgi:hypothetical protein